MSLARGTRSNAAIDEGWPYQVEIEVPWNGLGSRLGEMLAWLNVNAPKPSHERRGGARIPGRDLTRFCFADRDLALGFSQAFGGEVVTADPPRRRRGRAG